MIVIASRRHGGRHLLFVKVGISYGNIDKKPIYISCKIVYSNS